MQVSAMQCSAVQRSAYPRERDTVKTYTRCPESAKSNATRPNHTADDALPQTAAVMAILYHLLGRLHIRGTIF